MADQKKFHDLEALQAFTQKEQKGSILISYVSLKDYQGMALATMIVFDINKSNYELDLQWMSLGLDFYGDTLQESYVYQFESLELLLDYLENNYLIKVTDIPMRYKFNPAVFPDPIKDEERKPLFEKDWYRFQEDFIKGVFLDSTAKLVF